MCEGGLACSTEKASHIFSVPACMRRGIYAMTGDDESFYHLYTVKQQGSCSYNAPHADIITA